MAKSEKNKTIDITIEQGKEYLDRCISLHSKTTIENVIDKTILGDTFDVLTKLPEKSVDLLLVDPPYNLDKEFHGNEFKSMSDDNYEDYIDSWITALIPTLKDNERVLKKHFYVQNRITWQREKGRGAKANWKNGMEDNWFATVSKTNYTFNVDDVKIRRKVIAPYKQDGKPKDWEETAEGKFRDTCPSNFWDDISIPYWSMPENTAHPTQKPEKLLAKLILASTNKGDIILDPFLGSGSTSVTAKKLGRHYIGIEQNPQYCVWAEKRLEMANSDMSIQGYTDGVFWERNTSSLQNAKKKGDI